MPLSGGVLSGTSKAASGHGFLLGSACRQKERAAFAERRAASQGPLERSREIPHPRGDEKDSIDIKYANCYTISKLIQKG